MTGVPLDTRTALLREHGSFSQAYSATWQPGLSHYGDARGFIAYKPVWGTAMVLADPVAPRELHADLIGRFLREHPDAAFCQISRPVAEILAPQNFAINDMGIDPRLDLASYDFSGKDKQNLRTAVNRAAKGGYVVRECTFAELGIGHVKALSDRWRSTRIGRNREISFLNRPLRFIDEPEVRKFFMFDRNGVLMALGGFDPIYRAGSVVGYIAQHNRHYPEVEGFADYAIKHHAIETFQREGRAWLFLGLAPLSQIRDHDFTPNKSWLVRRGFSFLYRTWLINRFIFPFQGHELHKGQFRGSTEQSYCAYSKQPTVARIVKILRACEII